MGKVYVGSKVVRSEGLGLKGEYSMCGKKYWKLYTVLFYRGVVYRLFMLYCKMSCVYCCSCLVCIVVVVLCVFVVLCVSCCFYFGCRTAG